MAKFLELIMNVLQTQGLVAASMLVLAGVILWIAQKFTPIILSHYLNKPKMSGALIDHPFFTRMSEWRTRRIPYLPIDRPIRRKLIIDTLDIQFHTYEQRIAEAVVDRRHLKESAAAYEKFWINVVIQATKKYEEEWRKIDAPDEWFEIFNEFNSYRVESMIKRISQIANSDFHSSFYSRDVAILDACLMVFWDTLIDAEKTLHGLNGRLSGKVYKGKEIE